MNWSSASSPISPLTDDPVFPGVRASLIDRVPHNLLTNRLTLLFLATGPLDGPIGVFLLKIAGHPYLILEVHPLPSL